MSGGCLVKDAVITLRGDVLLKPLVASGYSGELRRGAVLSKPGGATAARGLSEFRGSNPGGAGPAGFAWRRAACTWFHLSARWACAALLYASQKCDSESWNHEVTRVQLLLLRLCKADWRSLTSLSFAVLYILNARGR